MRLERAASGHRGRALVAALTGLAGAFVVAVAAVPPASAAGGVSLFDSANGAPMFNSGLLAPGTPQTNCVSVSAAGAGASDAVVLSASDVAGALAGYLTVTVDVGTGGQLGDCTGFTVDPSVAQWSGHLSDLTSGVLTGWRPGTSSTRTFRISVTVDGVPAAAGTSAGGKFVWQLTTAPPPPPVPTPTPTSTPSPTPTPTDPEVPVDPAPTTRPPVDPPTTTPAEPTQTSTGTATTEAPGGSPQQPDPGSSVEATPDATTSTPQPTSTSSTSDGAGLPGGPAPGQAGPGGGSGGDDTAAGRERRRADVVLGVPLPVLRETARRVGEVAMHIAEQPQYPLGVLALVAVFLLVQDLIDRRDPKLAVAQVTGREASVRFPDRFPPRRAT